MAGNPAPVARRGPIDPGACPTADKVAQPSGFRGCGQRVVAAEFLPIWLRGPYTPMPLLPKLANIGQCGNLFPQASAAGLSPP